jgi:DNA polymerase-3 subunit delta
MTKPNAPIARVYAVTGQDAFSKHETIEVLCRRIAADDGDGQGPVFCEGASADLAEVLDEVRTFSLLGGTRVVVLTSADGFISKHRQALERYCEAPADSGVLILECNSLPGNQRLHKIIAKQGQVIKHDPLRGRAINQWITRRARETYDKKIDDRAAWLLRELTGTALGLLDSELSKLAIFVRERPAITAQDIEALVGRHREEDVFGVIDAIADCDAARALAQWERVLATDRAAPARAVGGLAWGFRKLLDLKQQSMEGVPTNVLSRQAFTTPEILDRRLRATSVTQLQEQLRDLLEVDLSAKTGLSSVPVAIERFIIRHSSRLVRGKRLA